MNKFFKKALKIFLWFSGVLILLLLGIFLFIQTNTFNKLALDYAVEKLNEGLEQQNSKIEISSLNGNIFSGLILDSGLITIDNDTLLKFNYIDVKYDVWGLLDKQIRLEHLIINSPNVNFTKIKDSTQNLVWNFSKLFSSSDETDTSASTFDWDIAVNNLKIENGFFKTRDEFIDTTLTAQSHYQRQNEFDFNNLLISDLNLELNAKYFRDSKKINLQSFSFNSNSDFSVDKFTFDADINIEDKLTQLTNLEIITDRSEINFNKLVLSEFNPFDSTTFENFADKDFEADINIDKFDFSDLRFFVPDVNMLDSTISLTINAKGKYGDFNLNNLTLILPNSYINVKGNVQHLDDPDNLYLDIIVDNLDVLTKDVKTIYNDPSVPDLNNLGRVKANIKFTGTFEKFYSKYDINTDAGFAEGYTNLNLPEEIYSGTISTNNLNLGKILNEKSLKSNLNLYGDYSGKGFELNKMSSSLKYIISSSSFAGYDIRSSSGTINFLRNNINLNIRHFSSMGNAVVKGRVNIANMNNPVYALNGRVNNLNISKFTKNNEDNSNLNFSFNVNGRGSSLNNINGNFNFGIDDSFYGQNQIPSTPLNIEINNSRDLSSYAVSSDLLDFRAHGKFNIESLSNVITDNIELISEKFKNKLSPDSTSGVSPVVYRISPGEYDNFNLDYELILKDTTAVNAVTKPFGILFNGNISGSIVNEQNRFSLTSILDIKNFVYEDTLIILKNFTSDISLFNNYQQLSDDNSLSSIEMKLISSGEKVSFQNSVFDSVKIDLDLSNSLSDLKIRAQQDSSLYADVNGQIDLSSDIIAARFDSVNVNYGMASVSNEKDWLINYLPGQKINFVQFAVKSDDLVLNVSGDYVLNGNSDLKLEANDISLADLYSLIYPVDTSKVIVKQVYPVKGKITKLFVNFKGDADNPELTADITTGKLRYTSIDEDLDIGDISVKVDYKDESAAADISLNNADKGSLKITGDIPCRNPLSGKDSLIDSDFSGKSVDLKLTSQDFQLKYFLKLMPSLPDISGKLNGEITATGSASSPDLKGSIGVNDGNVYFGLTGMNYNYTLKTSTENSKLVINNLTLSSIDDKARHFDIFGNVDFSGMKINDIDLSTSGDMVFLDKDVSENELGVYGYFRAGSGSPPITIKGNLDKLSITGELLIVDATISSIPLGGSGYDNKVDNFTYISVSDTADNYLTDTVYTVQESDYYKINPFARYKYTFSEKESSASDFLDLDIRVKTQKNIYVSIDFDNITKDRLFGEITADLNLKTQDKVFHAVGDVNIINNSYYRFYKDFKLNNSKISFNGPISNPLLDIQAVHEGVKTTEQFGTVASVPVEVMLTIKGELDKPVIELKLIEDGTTVSGTDAQADAITFLLFGKYKSELSTSERTAVASSLGTSLGSLYISSIVSQTVRDILPFLIDAQFKYSQGNVTDTDVELTSELGEATIKVGGKLLKEIRNFEFVIDYPLNNFLNLNLPETLMLELSREEEDNIIFGSAETTTNTGLKIIYKIKY